MDSTPSQTIGPFFHLCLPEGESVGSLAGPGAEGEPVTIVCRVVDGDGAPIDDAMIEFWQADASGIFNHPADPRYPDHDPAFAGFARTATNGEGAGTFHTIKPGRVLESTGFVHAPHIDVSVFARGLLKRVVTRIYFENDPANVDDPVLALVPAERRGTLMARKKSGDIWSFDIQLCGEHETVFFEI